ncbi:MAG: 2,3-bisphosphoglycerate-independent phosphoglycerate mutase [Proteobacteria bacterium]|nr:2,3-bisphosphoglycerate-independent phosphoglycerate mutase [Pseudomonadota bacterium]MDA1355444.1 2,3-bisphosphoglycerate-independent phosphoglycerate mutase [Pseudomonadota bacterium]
MNRVPRPMVLCVLDGWGEAAASADNAIAVARTPVWDALLAKYPHSLLHCSGLDVGLPHGQMGNSEVGHMNLGAGRAVMQDLPRVDAAIKDGSLASLPALADFIEKLRRSGGRCHLMGLLSPGGVHAHQDHIAALVKILDGAGVPVTLHAFLDGRDTPPTSAAAYMRQFEADVAAARQFSIGTVCGRYWAMDRDQRWERVARAYLAITDAVGTPAPNAETAVSSAYAAGESDEFMAPAVIAAYPGMSDGDGLLMANFRADRARQLLSAFLDPAFDGFARPRIINFAAALGLVEYSRDLNEFMACLFPSSAIENVLGEVVSAAGRTQLRLAETEKYAHVTFFLNGGEECVFAGEERILVPSPKVATYDLQPEMSAREVTDRLVEAILSKRFDLIVVNYANTDMVGHTGIMPAAVKAVETVDFCLGRMISALSEVGGAALVTADHGNAERMLNAAGDDAHTAHTTNRVPAILIAEAAIGAELRDGLLADVAPTLLNMMALEIPPQMTGRPLLKSRGGRSRRATPA